MISSTAIRFAARFASRDETRAHLCRVNLEPTRAWATDGHRALIMRHDGAEVDECGIYDLNGGQIRGDSGMRSPPIDQVIPPADLPVAVTLSPEARQILASVRAVVGPRPECHLHVCEWSRVVATEFVSEARKKKYVKPTKIHIAVPLDGRPHEFGVNVDYLLDAIEALGFGPDESVPLRKMLDELSPIRIDNETGDVAVIMPVRL